MQVGEQLLSCELGQRRPLEHCARIRVHAVEPQLVEHVEEVRLAALDADGEARRQHVLDVLGRYLQWRYEPDIGPA